MAISLLAGALIGGGLLGSAALSSGASNKAAKTIQQGTDAAAGEQRRQFDEMLRLSMPGYNRANDAADLYGRALGIPSMTRPTAGTSQRSPQAGMMTGGSVAGPSGGPAYIQAKNATDGIYDTAGGDPAGGYAGIYDSGQSNVPVPQQTADGTDQAPLDITGQVLSTPGYQTQLDQGIKSIDRAAPLVGGMYSGRRMKALNDYGQQTFGTYYNNWLDRVGGVAGQAPAIAQNVGQAGMQNANNVGQLLMTGANAKAQGQMNSANAWTSAAGTGIGMFAGAKGWF